MRCIVATQLTDNIINIKSLNLLLDQSDSFNHDKDQKTDTKPSV